MWDGLIYDVETGIHMDLESKHAVHDERVERRGLCWEDR